MLKENHESRHADILKERILMLEQGVMFVDRYFDCNVSLRTMVAAIEEHDICKAKLSELAHELALKTEATFDRNSRPLPMELRSIEIELDRCTDRLYEAWIIFE